MTKRLLKSALLASLLGLTACGSASFSRVVSINPPNASLYINGERVGNGDKRVRRFSFSKEKRIYIQAVHPDFYPELEVYDERRVTDLINANLPLKITMRSR